jgi:hypothetical protein
MPNRRGRAVKFSIARSPSEHYRFVVGIIIVLATVLSVAPTVSANLSPPLSFTNLWDGFLATFLTNLPVNLLLLSFALWLTWPIIGEGLFTVLDSRLLLLLGLATSVLIVTATGAAIDIAFLYNHENGDYTLTASLASWTIAAILVFASVYLTTILVMKLDKVYNLVPALIMMAANVLWWSVLGSNTDSMFPPFIMGLACLFLAPLPLLELVKWHSQMIRDHQRGT